MDKKPDSVPEEHHRPVTGEWLPQDHREHTKFIASVSDRIEKNPKDLHPVLKEFKEAVESSTRLTMLSESMFDQIPSQKQYKKTITGKKQVRDMDHLLKIINYIIGHGPQWTDKAHRVGVVGVPINAVLDWPMGTSAGFAFFQDPEVNVHIKKVLNVWGDFLRSEESADCLDGENNGWFARNGVDSLTEVANKAAGTEKKFEELFVCDPSKPRYGYTSWDDFFTRPLRDGARPIASPEDDSVITNACESKPYKVATNVKARDKFWIKGQPYSVVDMLAHDALAEQFVGGTIYQAFLSALSYHRWHSPVSGKVVKAFVEDGSYYSEPQWEDFAEVDGHIKSADVKSQTVSQAYLTCVATRAIMFIEADNPAIGLMCIVAVGMTEVSTCDITVKEGQHLKKGDQLGMFHFGGSTHCLLFRKGVKVTGFPEGGSREYNVPVHSKLAVVEA